MPAAAALGAASIGGSIIGALGAKSAAKTQAKAATNAANMQLGMFNTIRDDLSPYRAEGTTALPAVYQMLGLQPPVDTSAASGAPQEINYASYVQNNPDLFALYSSQKGMAKGKTMDEFGEYHWNNIGKGEGRTYTPTTGYDSWMDQEMAKRTAAGGAAGPLGGGGAEGMQRFLEQTPGYQFQKQQGMQSVENALSARGLGGLSGSLGKGLARFVTGLADSTYQQQLGNYMNLVNNGQNAATQTGTFGTQAAQSAGGSLIGAGNAQAAGTVGAATALGQGLTGAANGYLTSRVLGMYGAQPAYPGPGYTPATDAEVLSVT